MNTKAAAANAAKFVYEPLETLTSQVAKPLLTDATNELGAFFGRPKNIGSRPQSIAHEDLERARNEQKLSEMEKNDNDCSKEAISKIVQEYREYHIKVSRQDESMKQQVEELQDEVEKLAKSAGVDTKAHLENVPNKVGVLHIKMLTTIIKSLRIKADESKSAKDLVSQRSNSKQTTGMLAWVSGKQMKVHEQGTLQLQG